MDNSIEERRFSLESRRYIGCKTKLVDWIFNLIDKQTHDVRSFCDIFAGTGVVAHRALQTYERVVVNDFLQNGTKRRCELSSKILILSILTKSVRTIFQRTLAASILMWIRQKRWVIFVSICKR